MISLLQIVNAILPAVPSNFMLENSYRNFHAKGVDYLCLFRDPRITIKAYFFSDDIEPGWLVAPHTHAYRFYSEVFAGTVKNIVFDCVAQSANLTVDGHNARDLYCLNKWLYHSPLNGGNGLSSDAKPVVLKIDWERTGTSFPGMGYMMEPDDIHTIDPSPGAVLLLMQFADSAPVTEIFSHQRPVCDDSNLYQPMDYNYGKELLDRLWLGKQPRAAA